MFKILSSKYIFIASVLLTLAGCANIAKTPANTPITAVIAQHGQPTLECTDQHQNRRAIWSLQPMGQYAWGTNINSANLIDQIVPILTDANFQQLKNGNWTPADVKCEFGPPAIIETIGLPSNRQIVWSYRYKQDGIWNSLMYVFFGTDGQQVTKFHPGPDPMFDPDHRFFGF